jgi:two-component system NtrC family sensor kinase
LTNPIDPLPLESPLLTGGVALLALNLPARHTSADFEASETQLAILNDLCQDVGFASAALYLMDNNDQLRWQFAGEKDAWEQAAGMAGLETIARQAISAGRLVSWQNSPDQGLLPAAPDSKNAMILSAPLVAGGEVLGVILVIDRHGAVSTESSVALLDNLASWLAGGLSRSRQLRQLQEANQALEARRLELLRSRDTLRALFDSTPTLMYIIDTEYSLLAVNRSRAGLAGEIPQRLVFRRCYAALFQREDPCPGCRVGETFVDGRNTRRIEQRDLLDYGAVDFEISSFPIHDETGQVTQAILFEEDVTEKRRLETSLAQAEKLAAIGQLAAGVAHEINNPLTAVIANAQLLQRALADQDEDLREMALLIQQAGERASGVVGELLDLARQDRVDLAPVDINETLREALALAQPRLAASGARLEFNPQASLPTVQADADRLVGVWLNLLINALDALDGGGGMIHVATWQEGQQVLVIVNDNGPGIPVEQVGRVFEPFFTTKDPGHGTGLGLSISHRVIRQMGGDIRLESQSGRGTTLTVSLPVAQEFPL